MLVITCSIRALSAKRFGRLSPKVVVRVMFWFLASIIMALAMLLTIICTGSSVISISMRP